jgi:hypothetical protein
MLEIWHELLNALMLSLTKNKINSFSIKALLWWIASVWLVLDNTGSKEKYHLQAEGVQ